jgi:hypothetical protein
VGTAKGKKPLGIPRIDGRIILKWILKIHSKIFWTEYIHHLEYLG